MLLTMELVFSQRAGSNRDEPAHSQNHVDGLSSWLLAWLTFKISRHRQTLSRLPVLVHHLDGRLVR